MLNSVKLRYLGIDLHSRARRRFAVALTWIALFLAMTALSVLFDSEAWFRDHPLVALLVAGLAAYLFSLVSVFRDGGAVRRFEMPVWKVSAGDKSGYVMLGNLDDWARYKYDGALAELPEEEQQQVLRTYKVGYYLFPADRSRAPERLDEREIAVRNQASTNALRWVVFFCFSTAGACASSVQHVGRLDLAMELLTIGLIGLYAPRALILWNEPNPREVEGTAAMEPMAG